MQWHKLVTRPVILGVLVGVIALIVGMTSALAAVTPVSNQGARPLKGRPWRLSGRQYLLLAQPLRSMSQMRETMRSRLRRLTSA